MKILSKKVLINLKYFYRNVLNYVNAEKILYQLTFNHQEYLRSLCTYELC